MLGVVGVADSGGAGFASVLACPGFGDLTRAYRAAFPPNRRRASVCLVTSTERIVHGVFGYQAARVFGLRDIAVDVDRSFRWWRMESCQLSLKLCAFTARPIASYSVLVPGRLTCRSASCFCAYLRLGDIPVFVVGGHGVDDYRRRGGCISASCLSSRRIRCACLAHRCRRFSVRG